VESRVELMAKKIHTEDSLERNNDVRISVERVANFKRGDVTYCIKKNMESVARSCDDCGGSGELELKKGRYNCPMCNGSGTLYKLLPDEWRVQQSEGDKKKIAATRVELWETSHGDEDRTGIWHMVGGRNPTWIWVPEEDLFSTLEEAERECRSRNMLGYEPNRASKADED
jgi:hypothetical protein